MLLSLADLITMATFLSVTPAIKDAFSSSARGEKRGTAVHWHCVSLLAIFCTAKDITTPQKGLWCPCVPPFPPWEGGVYFTFYSFKDIHDYNAQSKNNICRPSSCCSGDKTVSSTKQSMTGTFYLMKLKTFLTFYLLKDVLGVFYILFLFFNS